MAATTITADQVKQLRDKTGAGMMECKAALAEANGNMDEAITRAAQARARAGGQARGARDRAGHDRQLHPHGRQDRRPRGGELRVRLRGAHGRLPEPREGSGDAHRGRRPEVGPPRGRPRRGDREGKGHLPRADGEHRQAGQRPRQDRRGQAGQLLLAVRAARPAVDPRQQRLDRAADCAGQRQDRARTSRSTGSCASGSATRWKPCSRSFAFHRTSGRTGTKTERRYNSVSCPPRPRPRSTRESSSSCPAKR